MRGHCFGDQADRPNAGEGELNRMPPSVPGEELDGDTVGEGVGLLLAELPIKVTDIKGEAGGSSERVK